MKDQLKQAIIDGNEGVATAMTSALLATGASAREILDEGLRDSVKIMVGGAPVTAAYADEIGADGCGANAGMAVERAKELVG